MQKADIGKFKQRGDMKVSEQEGKEKGCSSFITVLLRCLLMFADSLKFWS